MCQRKINSLKSSVNESQTGALWIQYMEMIDILQSFVKPEQNGDWDLHLRCIAAMLPYFSASGSQFVHKMRENIPPRNEKATKR